MFIGAEQKGERSNIKLGENRAKNWDILKYLGVMVYWKERMDREINNGIKIANKIYYVCYLPNLFPHPASNFSDDKTTGRRKFDIQ